MSIWKDSFQARKHASYFTLSENDKQQNELEVANLMGEELRKQGRYSFDSIVPRESGEDPPDCEAIGNDGKRIGIEVTELVNGKAIVAAKRDKILFQNSPQPSDVIEQISRIIERKDSANKKDEQYDVYILIIYCDDPTYLDFEIHNGLQHARFGPTALIDHAYFLESYNPWKRCCPYIELRLD